jgi:hypothetical protein
MRRLTTLLSGAILLLGHVAAACAAGPQPAANPIPSLSEIKQSVLRYFQALPDYQSGDLITQDQVAPLLMNLKKMGLPLPNARQILERVPAKDEFLAKQLRTANGRKFMRDISGYKDCYDRIDRLARLPHGEQTVRDLIRGPDGYKMIEYMTTAPGGKVLGEQLSNAPGAGDFNAKTSRLYTVTRLLTQLEQCRAAAVKLAKKHQVAPRQSVGP